MRVFTKFLMATLLLCLAGVVSVSAKTEKVHATFEAPTNTNTTWDSATKTFTWSTTWYNQLRNIGLPSGDITKYKKLVVDCKMVTGTQFRVLFYKGGSNLTLYAKDGVNEFILKDELEKLAPNDYNEYLLSCDEICLSGDNGTAPGEAVVNDVYLETYDDEGVKEYATFEAPTNTNTTWDSATKTFTWSTTWYNQLRNIGLPSGDISKYKKLVVDCKIVTGTQFRVLFYKGGSNLTLYAKDGVNEFIIKDELEKLAPNDYNEYLLQCDEICLSGDNGTAPGEAVINAVYLETYPENESVEIPDIVVEEDPGKPAGDYVDFTEAFSSLTPNLGKKMGNGEVIVGARNKAVIADLADYSALTVVATPGLKLVFYMNHEVDAQQNAGDYAEADAGKYVFLDAQVGEDGLYTLDLTQYAKQELNAICLPWDNSNKGTVWHLLLTKKAAAPENPLLKEAQELAADADAVAVGKLTDAIAAYEKEANDEALKAAIDQFNADNEGTSINITEKVSTAKESWTGAGGTAGGNVTTSKGANAAPVELYSSSSAGVKLQQTVTGLDNGLYQVKVFATSHNARGEDGAALDGTADDVAYVFAQSGETTNKQWITASGVTPGFLEGELTNPISIEPIEVTNGELTIGLTVDRAGQTGWHTIQIYSLESIVPATTAWAAAKADLQAAIDEATAQLAAGGEAGKTELTAATKAAEAAKTSNKLNVAETLEAVAALNAAINAYKQAQLVLPEGVYYAYHTATGKFLSRGADWGTRAVVDNYGTTLNVSVNDKQEYILKGIDNKSNYGDDAPMYSDANAADRARTYIIDKVDGGFTLTNTKNSKFVTADAATGFVAGDADEADVWQFVTLAQRDSIVAAQAAKAEKAIAETAGLTSIDEAEFVEDGTVLTFKTGSAWTFNVGRSNSKADTNENGTEVFQGTGTFTQKVENLEEGLYKVSIQAFYRDGSNADVARNYGLGYNTSYAYLLANGSQIAIKSWAADRETDSKPNSMAEFAELAAQGKYISEGYAYVGQDGVLDLTVAVPAWVGNGWFIADNVTFVAAKKAPVVTHTWDFQKWSAATVANLLADAAASKIEGWSDVEKHDDAVADANPTETSKDNCFWAAKTMEANENGELLANGQVIEELKGLRFLPTGLDTRNLAIAVNYPKALSDYHGGAYLWLGGKGKNYFIIPAVKGGSTVKMGVESHKTSDARGVELYISDNGARGTKIDGPAVPTVYEEQEWTIPAGEAVDLIVYNTNGCHIYYIDAEQDQDILTTIDGVKTASKQGEIYNINGQRVKKAAKGLYIINGKKVFVK